MKLSPLAQPHELCHQNQTRLRNLISLYFVVIHQWNKVEKSVLMVGKNLQGNHACDVEATEVQGNILGGDCVCADTDTPISSRRVLGVWRHASESLQCLLPSPKISPQRHGCHPNAHPPGIIIIIIFLFLSFTQHSTKNTNFALFLLSNCCSSSHSDLPALLCILCGRRPLGCTNARAYARGQLPDCLWSSPFGFWPSSSLFLAPSTPPLDLSSLASLST